MTTRESKIDKTNKQRRDFTPTDSKPKYKETKNQL